jgi:hypothetical protein
MKQADATVSSFDGRLMADSVLGQTPYTAPGVHEQLNEKNHEGMMEEYS